jgi:hypothetical protein
MNSREIRNLIAYLPPRSPYPGGGASLQAGSNRQFREACLAVCLNDPKFGYNFVMSFVKTEQPLPPGVFNLSIRRDYFAQNHRDDIFADTYALSHPANTARRRIINALLICRDITTAEIASKMDMPVETLELYEQLWFNVRDRLDDPGFIAGLLYANTRLSNLEIDSAEVPDYDIKLLRAAHEFGAAEVLYLTGVVPSREQSFSNAYQAQELEFTLMDIAVTQARYGSTTIKSAPAVDRAKSLLIAAKKGGSQDKRADDVMGLGAISASRSILDTIQRVQQPDIARRIELQQKTLDAEKAAEKAKTKS